MSAYREAETAINSNAVDIDRLEEKMGALSRSIAAQAESVERADKVRKSVLEDHAMDKATAEELTVARSTWDAATKALREEQELLEAVQKAHKTAIAKIPSLSDHKLGAGRRIWAKVQSCLVDEIKARSGQIYFMALCATRKMGSDGLNIPWGAISQECLLETVKDLEQGIFE